MKKVGALTALFGLLAFPGCTGDLGIAEFNGSCEKDSDCGEGYRCDPQAGCVAHFPWGGPLDAGGHTDVGHDARPVDGGDAGPVDTGPGRDGGIFLRYLSTSDSAAGVSVSPSKDLILKSSTGWSTGPRRSTGNTTLQVGQPWAKK